jgi:hypothetical protein
MEQQSGNLVRVALIMASFNERTAQITGNYNRNWPLHVLNNLVYNLLFRRLSHHSPKHDT